MTTPDILDLHPELPFILDFNCFSNKKSFFGKLVTVDCPDDNSLVREILSTDGNKSVLFINGNNSKNVAHLGDNLALLGKQNNWSGVIVNGCVRDVEILQSLDFGIYARGSCPKKSKKEGKGKLNSIFKVDNVEIKSSQWIYADENGIVISEHEIVL